LASVLWYVMVERLVEDGSDYLWGQVLTSLLPVAAALTQSLVYRSTKNHHRCRLRLSAKYVVSEPTMLTLGVELKTAI